MYTFRHSVFLVARLIARNLKIVPVITTIIGVLTLIYLNIGVYSIPSSIFLLALIALTWWNRREFDRISYIYAWEDIVKDFGAIGIVLITTIVLLARI